MAVQMVDITIFLQMAQQHPVLDVRSPGEFKHAHIPGAFGFPLFTDEERKVVGTIYKQQSREDAIKIGLDYFGPKMKKMVEEAENILHNWPANKKNSNNEASQKTILIHCWRGGMRSAAVAWLLDLYGFKVYSLKGGYKAFRNDVLQTFTKPYNIQVLGGYTGSGKTLLLQKLQRLNEVVVDLEALAHHKGSAFGHLGQAEQPTQEMFENKLATELKKFQHTANTQSPNTIWVEDESLRIGHICIPQPFYKQMRHAPCWFLDIPFEKRLQYICKDYGVAHKEKLISSTLRIQKRLGGLETQTAVAFLIENNIEEAFKILLRYYDKWYLKGLYSKDEGRRNVINIHLDDVDEAVNVPLILNACHQHISAASKIQNG